MDIIDSIKSRVRGKKTRIILPEISDERVLKAATIINKEDIADVVFIGNEKEIKTASNKFNLNNIEFIDPYNSHLTEKLIDNFLEIRKGKNISYNEAKKLLLSDYMYYACMLVKMGYADGVVSGASHSSANTLRPALQIIKAKQNTSLVSAFFLMAVPGCNYGENGVFIFADSGLNQNPTQEELAEIAISSAESFELLVGKEAKVAMLSHSTKGSANHPDVLKVVNATQLAKKKNPNFKIDGELQVDAAIVPEIAKIKAPNSDVAGNANVLIFPDLDAGNNAYKLVERLANAEAYGPITQGIASPVNDLSRGCSVDDIVGVVAITALQAQKKLIKKKNN